MIVVKTFCKNMKKLCNHQSFSFIFCKKYLPMLISFTEQSHILWGRSWIPRVGEGDYGTLQFAILLVDIWSATREQAKHYPSTTQASPKHYPSITQAHELG